ncbi:MAG: hypothetical protein Q9174_006996, partial [Haloplaca sp. 1 TL-2023]
MFGSHRGEESLSKSNVEKSNPLEDGSPAQGDRRVAADRLARKLSARQVQMIAIGGTIGTGLFLGTGKSLATGGPASMLIGYAIVGAIGFVTMLSLGEMAAFVPVAGSFCTFAGEGADRNTSSSTGLVCRRSSPSSSVLVLFVLTPLTLFQIFIILGIAVNAGANPENRYIGGENWLIDDAPFVDGGTESIAITAGETKDPARTIPKVVRNVFWRILLFYILSVLILGLNIPYTTPDLDSEDARTSPFTIIFQIAGSKAAGSFINAVIITSVLSAANHALCAGTRLLYTLAINRHAPILFAALNRNQIPSITVLATSAISILCFGASFIGA